MRISASPYRPFLIALTGPLKFRRHPDLPVVWLIIAGRAAAAVRIGGRPASGGVERPKDFADGHGPVQPGRVGDAPTNERLSRITERLVRAAPGGPDLAARLGPTRRPSP